jgi:hypothetical protein
MDVKQTKAMLEKSASIIEELATKNNALTETNERIMQENQAAQAKLAEYQKREKCEAAVDKLVLKKYVSESNRNAKVAELMALVEDPAEMEKIAEFVEPAQKNDFEAFGDPSSGTIKKTAEEKFYAGFAQIYEKGVNNG